jgi:hypothetical protein
MTVGKKSKSPRASWLAVVSFVVTGGVDVEVVE